MTIRYSTGYRNFTAKRGSMGDALQNGKILLYSGAQPASPDAAPTGTLLCTITDNSGAHTPEVQATGSVTLTGGAAGSVDTVTINGVNILGASVPFNGTLAQTATDVASQINRYKSQVEYVASASGATVTLTALPGAGTGPNGFAVSGTSTTITTSFTNMAGGVNPVNGLKFDNAVAGVMAQYAGQTWSGQNVADGVVGWFRFVGSVADSGALDSAGTAIRVDGSVGTAGADLTLNNTSLANGATTRISSATATIPAQ